MIFLKDYLKKHSFLKTYVLGISGGQDSTLAGRLAQLAIEEMRAETGDASYQFIAVRLPYGVQADEDDAQRALAFIQPDVSLVVNIKESADAMTKAVEATGATVSDFNKGNIKARSRMIAQYALAGSYKGAVVGTDHAAENVTGFFTKFGDGGADILPFIVSINGKVSNCWLPWALILPSMRKYRLRIWKKKSQALQMKSLSVSLITKLMTIWKVRPFLTKRKQGLNLGGIKGSINAICRLQSSMIFGNKQENCSDSRFLEYEDY